MPEDSDPIEQRADAAPEPGSLDDLLAGLQADGEEAEPQPEPVADVVPVDVPDPEDDAMADEQTPDEQPIEDGSETTVDPMPTGHAEAGLVEGVGGGLTWIPYAAYLAAWLVLAGASAYLLKDATPESPARWMPEYAIIVWTGVGLTALGPLLSLVVWLVARSRRTAAARRGLLVSALVRGALTAVFGVLIWAATIYVLELVATGVIS